jgi:gas vesicle protein
MWGNIIVALIAFAGTVIGSVAGIMAANKLVVYRIEQLEKKVDKHNSLIERMYEAETRIEVVEEKIKVANHRIDDLEGAQA